MNKTMLSLGLAMALLAGCTTSPDRYAVVAPETTQSQRIAFRSLEVRDVSLPAYAATDEITVLSQNGVLESDGAVLWADTPARAIALELTRHLARLSQARVASEPWPFEEFPQARLDIRFETLLASADGRYRAAGQYFVAVESGGRERAGLFDLTVSFDPAGGPAAIAAARGQLILDLAVKIARDGLR